jgi:hypothetical protein
VGFISQGFNHQSRRGNSVSIQKQILVTLRYYSTGSFQTVTGDTIEISQQTVSTTITRVSKAICRLYNRFIIFPTNENIAEIMNGFLDGNPSTKHFPGMIGVIERTHVEVLAAGATN